MRVREIMTEEVATAAPDTTLEEVATIMRDEDTGVVPVLDNSELVGLVTDRDIVIRCIAAGKDPSEITADEIFSEDLETVEPDADVEEASRLMAQKQIRRLAVVEDGRLVGMVSLGDIAVKASDQQAAATLEKVSQRVKTSRKSTPSLGEKGGAPKQARVVPIRNQGKTTRKRRAS
jgi:CBS domain-containing protein